MSSASRARLAGGVACAVASAILEVVPYLAAFAVIGQLVGSFSGTALDAAFVMQQALVALVAELASLALGFAASMLCHTYAFRALCDIRIALIERLAKLPMGRFVANASGKTMQVLDADVDQLEGFIAHQLPNMVSTVCLLVAVFAVMFVFDARLAAVALVAVVVGFCGQFVPMIKLLKSGALEQNFSALERINAAATEYVHGMPSVKLFGQTPRSFAGFQRDIIAYRDFTVGLSKHLVGGVSFFRTVVVSLPAFIAPVACALLLGAGPDADFATVVVFFLVFAPAATMPVLKLRTFSEGMNLVQEAASRAAALLDEEPLPCAAQNEALVAQSTAVAQGKASAAQDAAAPGEASTVRDALGEASAEPASSARGAALRDASVSFSHVSFSYATPSAATDGAEGSGAAPAEGAAEAPTPSAAEGAQGCGAAPAGAPAPALALDDVAFDVPAGSLVAVVGGSGAGKSTLAQLLCRFWDVDAGSVSIGGVDVRALSEDALMASLSFVFQENHVFSATVAQNVSLARPDATRAEIEAALAAAHASEFVAALPQGLDTLIGEGGVGLSGGERQRIAIARAFLKDAPILVLDEPTASLDADTEREVQDALAALAKGRTVIMVAHRLATVARADQILVMDAGRVVERGTHEELCAADGVYARLWKASQDAGGWSLRGRQRAGAPASAQEGGVR